MENRTFIGLQNEKVELSAYNPVCKKTNYFTNKTKAMVEKKLEMKKFCSTCRKTTPHKESKK